MKKWWIGAALAAMCVAQSARAQYAPGGGALLPDPVPVAPCPPGGGQGGPELMPGPLTGSTAPPGPENGLSLPSDVPTAWGRGPIPEAAAYLSVGGMGLMRQRPGRGVIAEVGQQPVLTTADLDPGFNWGGRATFGYLYDDAAIELTGFYLPEQQTSASFTETGQVALFFKNAPPAFLGPTGAGLLTRADTVTLNLKSAMGDAELNYRWWSRSSTGFEGIVGLRYMNVQERADVTAGTDIPSLTDQATYMARVNNNLLLAQTGFEWDLPLAKWLSLGVIGKGAIGADYIDVTTRLTNGLGIVGANAQREDWTLSSVYEIDAFFDIVQFEKVRLRVGYTAMWVVHVAEGYQQVNFDLSSQPASVRTTGTIFYHGPLVEVEFLF